MLRIYYKNIKLAFATRLAANKLRKVANTKLWTYVQRAQLYNVVVIVLFLYGAAVIWGEDLAGTTHAHLEY